jgi:hypothetical protein
LPPNGLNGAGDNQAALCAWPQVPAIFTPRSVIIPSKFIAIASGSISAWVRVGACFILRSGRLGAACAGGSFIHKAARNRVSRI